VVYDLSGQTSAVGQRGCAVLRLAENVLDSTRTRGEVTVVSQDISRHTLVAAAEGGIVTHPKPGAEFDPWVVQRGPRLFGAHDFTGTRTTWFAFEDRILVADEILGLMAVGLAPFFDYGGAWYGNEPARQGGDAGLALRFGPTRAVRGGAAELGCGYRVGQGMGGEGGRWTGRGGRGVGGGPSWRSAIDSGRECRGSAGRSRCGKGSRSETAQGAGMMTHVDWIGWLATAVFLVSYFTKTPVGLRRVQGVAAGLWALYGVRIHSLRVIVANLLLPR